MRVNWGKRRGAEDVKKGTWGIRLEAEQRGRVVKEISCWRRYFEAREKPGARETPRNPQG